MIDLYTWNTPNGQKPAILLEELGLQYDLVPVAIKNGVQHKPDFVKINPNSKIPALVDRRQHQEVSVFESGAILIYLAQKEGRFIPESPQAFADTLAWTFWQVGGLGPMIGQWGHFHMLDETIPYASERYLSESIRLLNVLEQRLTKVEFLSGEDYTIADMMVFPWVVGGLQFLNSAVADRLPELPFTKKWINLIKNRPAVQRANARMEELDSFE